MFDAFQRFQSGSEDTETEVNIGTVEEPRHLSLVDNSPIPTGRNAERSVSDRWRRFLAGDKKDKDAFFPADTRAQRRAQRRAARTTQRKHQRGYFRRELAKENAARDLLNLFQIADGAVPASPIMRNRAQERIAARVKYLRDEQQKAYDKAIAARQKNRDLPAPSPIDSHEAIRAQLWNIAKTAVLPVPRGARPSKAEEIRDLTRAMADRAITTGRTGRAG